MDFVVVGLGVGALAVLLGLTVRDAVPRWWGPDSAQSPAQIAQHLAIGRACRAGGLVLSLAGAAIVVVTLLAIGLGVSDRVGAILVMAAISVAVLGGIAWGVLFTHRYHPRPRRRPLAVLSDEPPSLAATIDAAVGRHDAWAEDAAEPAASAAESDEAEAQPAPLPPEDDAAAETPDAVEDDTDTEAGPALTALEPPVEPEADTGAADEPEGQAMSDDGDRIVIGEGRSRSVANGALPKDQLP